MAAVPDDRQILGDFFRIREEVRHALALGAPVVALESCVISHGMPFPHNLEAAQGAEMEVRSRGAVPATIAVLDGFIHVGLDAAELVRLAQGKGLAKISRRDLPVVVARGGSGGTTVSATMICARLAGIAVFATGGIGGVHRGAETTMDVSADLPELARSAVAVVCAGAKLILDLPRTLEVLETLGVPVIGYGTDTFPAFYLRSSGLPVAHRMDTPEEIAALLRAKWRLGLEGGVVIANPIPEEAALDEGQAEAAIARALSEAQQRGVGGKELTPFLLDHLAHATAGRSRTANLALLQHNAGIAAQIAKAYAALTAVPGAPS